MGNGNGDKDGTNEAGVGDENGNRDEGRRGHRANEGTPPEWWLGC